MAKSSHSWAAWSLADYPRAARACVRFTYEECWIEEPVTVRMPRLGQKRMEVLSREDARKILSVAGTRDRALVMTLIDSGLRRGEALALDWEDVDLRTGAVHVRSGKGRKARTALAWAWTVADETPRCATVERNSRTRRFVGGLPFAAARNGLSIRR